MAQKLDENSVIPLYYQVEQILRERIKTGTYKPEDLIPTEAELQKEFSVSRATVRQAVLRLLADKLIIRRRGKGTVVAKPRIEESLPRLVSFTEEMRSQRHTPSTRSIRVEEVDMPGEMAHWAGVSRPERCILVERVRSSNGVAIAAFWSYLPVSLGVTKEENFGGSLYQLLEEKYEIRLGKAEQIIFAESADTLVSRLLEIKKGSPVLIIERLLRSGDGRLVEYVRGVYRADRYQYRLTLER